jgi:hypothetical protein
MPEIRMPEIKMPEILSLTSWPWAAKDEGEQGMPSLEVTSRYSRFFQYLEEQTRS